MNPEEIQPESPVELEAIVRQNMEANDKLGSIEMNTEANVLAAQETTQGLKDIDATLEAQIHQAETHKKDMMPSMEALGKAMGFAATLLEKLEGPPGKDAVIDIDEIFEKLKPKIISLIESNNQINKSDI